MRGQAAECSRSARRWWSSRRRARDRKLVPERGFDVVLGEAVVGEDGAAVLAEARGRRGVCGGADRGAELHDRAGRAAVDREEHAAILVERVGGELVELEHRLGAAVV